MRFILFIGASLAVAGCTTPPVEATAEQASVNPLIAERIEARVEDGRNQPRPDLADLPRTPPPLPPEAERQAERNAVLTSGATLAEDIETARLSDPDSPLAERGRELLDQIERDRALAAAEGPLRVDTADPGTAPASDARLRGAAPVDPANEK